MTASGPARVPSRLLPLFSAALAVLAAASWVQLFLQVVIPAAFVDPWKRPASWVAARLVVEGRYDLLYADGRLFGAEARRLGAIPDIFAANAPTTFLPYLPLAWLPVGAAQAAWVLFSLLCFAVALLVILRALRLPLVVSLAVLALAPLFQPARYNLLLGQAYAQALLLVALGSVLAAGPGGVRGWRHAVAGLLFALGMVVRLFYGLAQLLPPLLRLREKVVLWALGLFAAACAIAAALMRFDPSPWISSARISLEWRYERGAGVTAYQSLNNLLAHLFRRDATWNPAPLADLPWLIDPLWWALALAILGLTAAALWRRRAASGQSAAWALLPYALATPLALLLAPVSEDYHHTQALFPLLVVGAILWEQRRPSRGFAASVAALAGGALLLGGPWPYYNVPGTGGWWAFLYYPRLYGNLLLWAWCVVLLLRRGPRRAAPRENEERTP